MKMVAFGHRKDVGKDTAAKLLISYLRINKKNSNIQIAGFADILKHHAYDLFSWAGLMSMEFYEEESNKPLKDIVLPKIGKSPRQIWIESGQKVREIWPYVYVEYMFNKYSKADVLIIKDLRYPTEADGILANGGFLVKIDRPGREMCVDGADDLLEGYTKWSHHINNDGTLNDFYTQIMLMSQVLNL